ncbi:VCBS repeat domain-containing M23 family metallopeptidase [Asanoa sp. NPDC049573]|uniref:VCBS repeat domain-containing M23 family metallopeptidase n=1 Tax=Asanoa sp. NPDC049573 TaxID=3155396 RepID=UPI00343A6C40
MRLRTRLGVLAPAVGLALAASMLVVASPASAAGPSLELPFTCGSSWLGKSGGSSAHRNYEIDWNLSSGAEDKGKPVLAAAAGTIRWEGGESSDYGNFLEIDHGGGYSTLYAHLDAKLAHNGDVVRQGQQIGTVGNTDGNSPGISPHLHFEFRNRGSGQAYPDYIRPASFHGDPFDYATGQEIYVSQNCGVNSGPTGTVSDFSGDGAADVLGVNAAGDLLYYPNNNYALSTPIKIGNGWGTFKHVMAADFSGDGAADVLGVDATGRLLYYPNNDYRLSTPIQIGSSWTTFRHVMAADFSGDGAADVLGVDANGNLLYYPNNNYRLSTPIQIGNGWSTFKQVMAADFNGDGKADVLGVDANGNLLYYRNTNQALSSPTELGFGFGTFKHVFASDFSGDGAADVLGVDSAGALLYYPNNNYDISGHSQIGNSWSTFPFVM